MKLSKLLKILEFEQAKHWDIDVKWLSTKTLGTYFDEVRVREKTPWLFWLYFYNFPF